MKLTFTKTIRDGKERESMTTDNFKLEAFASTDANGIKVKKLKGVAIVVGPLSDDRGGYKVRIAKGAAMFTPSVLALYDHNYANVIGNTANGTLKLSANDAGDIVVDEMILPDTSMGNDVYTLVRDGYVSGMSFGTIPVEYREVTENGEKIVEYTKMLVDEVTVTVIPAFTSTSIEVKAEAPEATPTEPEPTQAEASEPETGPDFASDEVRLSRLRLEMLGD